MAYEGEIKVGDTYLGIGKARYRTITRLDYWWNRNYHGLVYYAGRDGREIEMDEKRFRKWAVSKS